MPLIYIVLFVLFAAAAAVLECTEASCFGWADRRRGQQAVDKEYLRFRNSYVVVFSLMMAGDWLQGPYVYHLYEYYGYSVRDIGRLFIMGFGSSAVFGTLAGAMADREGRKRAALMYVATYSLSCLTKHSPNYYILMIGRLLGGTATSLLFSAFESWAVAAHTHAGFQDSRLSDLFTKAVFWGNGLMAIASGLLGNILVESLDLGPVAPFDAAIAVLVVGGVMIQLSWAENFGERGAGDVLEQFNQALRTIYLDPRVALLGASQALFEASMYTFVFLWTPSLSPNGEKLPHGFIFAIFMTASMVGTALAGKLIKQVRLERLMQAVFWCSAVSLFVPVLFHTRRSKQAVMEALLDYANDSEHLIPINKHIGSAITGSSSSSLIGSSSSSGLNPQLLPQLAATNNHSFRSNPAAAAAAAAAADHAGSHPPFPTPAAAADQSLSIAGSVQLVAFCVFEVLIGIFWPSMMTLRARYVPEEQRSTIINIFRIPLNLFVCIILWKVSDFPLGVIFALCSLFLVAAAGCQHKLASLSSGPANKRSGSDLGNPPSKQQSPQQHNVLTINGCGRLHQQQQYGAGDQQQQHEVQQHIAVDCRSGLGMPAWGEA